MLRKGETGLERLMPLCSLLKGVMLRRTKDDVGMPHRKLSALLARKLCLKLATQPSASRHVQILTSHWTAF